MTYRSLKGSGLTAIYVQRQREQPSIDREAYTVPVAIDPDGNAAKKLGITSSGTVLINRLGKVAYADTLSRNSQDLVRALQKPACGEPDRCAGAWTAVRFADWHGFGGWLT